MSDLSLLYTDPFWSWMLVLFGYIFLFLEIFIPSGGILGALALASTGFGVFGLYHQDRWFFASLALAGFIVYMVFMINFVLRRLAMKGTLTPRTSNSLDERIEGLLGTEGVALTPLRPAGVALILGKKVDVLSAGDFIEKDSPVQVIDTSSNRVVVRQSEGKSYG